MARNYGNYNIYITKIQCKMKDEAMMKDDANAHH